MGWPVLCVFLVLVYGDYLFWLYYEWEIYAAWHLEIWLKKERMGGMRERKNGWRKNEWKKEWEEERMCERKNGWKKECLKERMGGMREITGRNI